MRVAHINAVNYGSTGRIMFQLADALADNHDTAICTSGFTWRRCERDDYFITSNIFEKTIHTYLARLTGRIGCFSILATRKFIRRLDAFEPDVIHLHNLHGWFMNLPMLFGYIKKKKIPVVWTLHDCWAMTGHCPHFTGIGCNKWKQGCGGCPLYRQYPQSWVDRSAQMYALKKKWFTNVENLTIAAPSQWVARCVGESFLQDYPVRVIGNGIDLQMFCPRESHFRQQHGCEDKYIVLGVAYDWSEKKGLDVFLKLAEMLDDAYQIVLVGTDETVDSVLPERVISIHRTQNPMELAQIYTAADVFVNPTREDTYPTVNMEALACGTPVVTFDTGGSPEIPDETCGCTVPCGDVAAMVSAIRKTCVQQPYLPQMCLKRAEAFDQDLAIRTYLELYRSKL